jgi:hypothetical protein
LSFAFQGDLLPTLFGEDDVVVVADEQGTPGAQELIVADPAGAGLGAAAGFDVGDGRAGVAGELGELCLGESRGVP